MQKILEGSESRSIQDYYDVSTNELGKGTYGKVVQAKIKDSDAIRAIKIIPKTKVTNLERFKTEIDIMKKLDHPNILRLYESFEDSENVYLVLELCEGGELFDRIISKKYFEEEEGREIFRQIIKAIYYCHTKNVCHRDLKPENFLFLSSYNEDCLKLIDFGLSKSFFHTPNAQMDIQNLPKGRQRRAAPKSNMKTRAGTPFYIAPEVLTGNYDEKCDVWSAGVILYILLCGYPPFYGETNKEILEQVKKGKLDFSGPEWKSKSEKIFDLLKKMICAPEDRLSAVEVLQHEWMTCHDKKAKINKVSKLANPSKNQLCDIYKKVFTYVKKSRFVRTVLIYLARQLNEREVLELQEGFNIINTSNDGEMKESQFVKTGVELGFDEKKLQDIFSELDIGKVGLISYTQFIAACLLDKLYLKDDNMYAVFRTWDMDCDGALSVQDLSGFLSSEYPGLLESNFGKEMMLEFETLAANKMRYTNFYELIKI